jgi:uncharacterized protein
MNYIKILLVIFLFLLTPNAHGEENILLATSKAMLRSPARYSEKQRQTSTSKIVANFYLEFYRKNISPIDGDKCVFQPSCSRFAKDAFLRYGFLKGSILTADRLTRCHGKAYYDKSYKKRNGQPFDPVP